MVADTDWEELLEIISITCKVIIDNANAETTNKVLFCDLARCETGAFMFVVLIGYNRGTTIIVPKRLKN